MRNIRRKLRAIEDQNFCNIRYVTRIARMWFAQRGSRPTLCNLIT
jgi:hypothetical protein